MECKEEAVTVISGFAMCERHAKEMVYTFNTLKAQARQIKLKQMNLPRGYSDPDLKDSKSMNIGDRIDVSKGKWRNVKNIR